MKIHLVELSPSTLPEYRSLSLYEVEGNEFDVVIVASEARIGVPKDAPIEDLASLLKIYAPAYKATRKVDLFRLYGKPESKRPGPPPREHTNRPAKPV